MQKDINCTLRESNPGPAQIRSRNFWSRAIQECMGSADFTTKPRVHFIKRGSYFTLHINLKGPILLGTFNSHVYSQHSLDVKPSEQRRAVGCPENDACTRSKNGRIPRQALTEELANVPNAEICRQATDFGPSLRKFPSLPYYGFYATGPYLIIITQ